MMLFCCKNKSEAEDILKILKREHKSLAYAIFFKILVIFLLRIVYKYNIDRLKINKILSNIFNL